MSIFAQAAKTTFYSPNGAGRDSYIYCNNGGLTAKNSAIVQPPVGKITNPVIHSRHIRTQTEKRNYRYQETINQLSEHTLP